uniref:Uncharacterized protein n=1 Tax=Arundo donax TaxID=35708 RepID=A0A0A8ZGW5_ARUDO
MYHPGPKFRKCPSIRMSSTSVRRGIR